MKIAITGPESSGKTSLAIALAQALEVCYVPEFARFLLQAKGPEYAQSDLFEMAKQQITWWQRAGEDFVADTDLTVFRVWEEVRFKDRSKALQELSYDFDAIILCSPDIPWEEDPLREDEHDRDYLFDLYEKELSNIKTPHFIVSGDSNQRLHSALKFIETEKGR